jgi:hypothetical protein
MDNEVKTENADSVENTATEQPQELTNISEQDFVQKRLAGEQEVDSTPEQDSEVLPENNDGNKEDENTGEPNVHSQVDLEQMSEEELRELSEKLGSRAVARFGELTAKRKAAEEKAAALEKQLNARPKQEFSDKDIQDNPYKDLKTPKELQDKSKELNDVIEWAEETLFDSDQYSANDVVTTVEGRDLTKKDVRNALLNARKNKNKFLPMQRQMLRQEHMGVQLRKGYEARAVEELSWMSEENSEVKSRYEAMLKDPRLGASLKGAIPEVKAQLPYLLAHAANSMYGRKVLPTNAEPAKANVKLDPPKVTNNASQPARSTSTRKQAAAIHQQFKSSGESSDFIKLRTLQLANR